MVRGQSWRALADVPEHVRDALPRGYDIVGTVAIIRLPDQARAYADEVGRALLEAVPNAETAAADHGVEGELRARNVEVLAGKDTLVTDHRENGCRLLVDLAHCYYSPRLAGERDRVASQVRDGERVLDLYCGVGPYAVLIAGRADAHVLGLELNPVAARLCRDNAARNKVAARVDVAIADAPALARAMPAAFDRLVMNLPHDAVGHLGDARAAAAPGAVLHVGAMLARDSHETQAAAIADAHGLGLERVVHVRNYNPAVRHYTLDLRVPDAG